MLSRSLRSDLGPLSFSMCSFIVAALLICTSRVTKLMTMSHFDAADVLPHLSRDEALSVEDKRPPSTDLKNAVRVRNPRVTENSASTTAVCEPLSEWTVGTGSVMYWVRSAGGLFFFAFFLGFPSTVLLRNGQVRTSTPRVYTFYGLGAFSLASSST